MRLLLFGKSGPAADRLAGRAVRELEPDVFLQLTRTGLAVPAAAAAVAAGVPVRRYWPDFLSNRGEAMKIAVEQLAMHEHPLTIIVLSPRPEDAATISFFTEIGRKVIIGRFGPDREVEWEEAGVLADNPLSAQVLQEKLS